MESFLTFHQFLIALLASFGVYPIVFFLVTWCRKIFFASRQLRQTMSSDRAIASLGDAYAEENESKLRQAELQYAYSKLEKLSNSKTRPYRQRLADLREVRERQLPPDEYLLKLLSSILEKQSDPQMKFEVLSYYLLVKEEVEARIVSLSLWLAAAAVGIYFLVQATLDALEAYQLLAIVGISTAIILSPAWAARNKFQKKVLVSSMVLLSVFAYLAGYSLIHHILNASAEKDLMGMQVGYHRWISSPLPIPGYQNPTECGATITIKSTGGNSAPATIPQIVIKPIDNTNLYDEDCNPLFLEDTIPAGAPPREALMYKVSQKSATQWFHTDLPLKITVTFTDPVSNKTETASLQIRQEHILWYYSRLGFGGLAGVLFSIFVLNGIGKAVSKFVEDAASKRLTR